MLQYCQCFFSAALDMFCGESNYIQLAFVPENLARHCIWILLSMLAPQVMQKNPLSLHHLIKSYLKPYMPFRPKPPCSIQRSAVCKTYETTIPLSCQE